MQVSESITKKSASNLALAFILLPKEKREGMSALYAFCREVDDVADDESVPSDERRKQLGEWRDDIRKACTGGSPEHPVNQELKPFIEKHGMPFELFDELIKGVEMDLDQNRYETWEQLELYCYRVASVVGLLSIHIFEYSDPRCKEYAVYLGKALQFTNILRDVGTDAELDRVYLPAAALREFGVTEAEILQGRYSDRYEKLARHMAGRARDFYDKAAACLPAADRKSMATAELMGSVYWGILRKLEERRFNVFDEGPAKLTKAQKIGLILRMWLRNLTGAASPNYGGV